MKTEETMSWIVKRYLQATQRSVGQDANEISSEFRSIFTSKTERKTLRTSCSRMFEIKSNKYCESLFIVSWEPW